MRSRHQLRVREDLFRPLPVKSEAVTTQNSEAAGELVETVSATSREGDCDLEVLVEDSSTGADVEIIDLSESRLSAAELYENAVRAGVSSGAEPSKAKFRTPAPTPTKVPLWGSGTSGMPRRGSRSVRLFHCAPGDLIASSLPFGKDGPLVVDQESVRISGEDLHAQGSLAGAYTLRRKPVEVSLRICRFNSMFTITEVTLESRRHPRRFFATAHRAIDQLFPS